MAFQTTFTLVDDYGRQTSKSFESEATTLTDAQTWGAALLADILAFSQLGSLMTTNSDKEVTNNAPESGSNVDTGATIRCRLDNGKVYAFKMPAPDVALINPDGTIDITNALVTDLIGNFMSAGHYRVSEGNVVVTILGGELDR
jgi:hypothetical protein